MKGISSNKVINNCFEKHVELNKGRLDETKMRDVLSSLRKDLGIPSDSESSNYFLMVKSEIEFARIVEKGQVVSF